MRLKLFMFMMLAGLLGAGCASNGASEAAGGEGGTEQPAGEQVADADDPDNKVICRREHVVGSQFPRRVCKTVRQIREEQEQAQRELDRERLRMQRRAEEAWIRN